MTDERGYQGWTNYETWCVNLWLSNDEPLYRDMIGFADEYLSADDDGTGDIGDSYRFGLAIREYVESLEPAAQVLSGASFVSDLLGSALADVDWSEIAESWLQDAKELREYEPTT